MKNKNTFSVVTGVMLLLAIPPIWPYGYYQLLRWVVAVCGLYNSHQAYESKQERWMIIMIVIAILFNPLSPFSLAKSTWVVVDLVAAIAMFAFSRRNKKHNQAIV